MDLQGLLTKLRNTITRVVTDRRDSTGRYQVEWGGDRASSGVEHIQSQGVHFAVPSNADAILVAPTGDRSAAVIVAASGDTPTDNLPPGAGGLHYLGEWRVFVADDGSVHLGSRDPSDFVALASKVDQELTAIKADLDAFKSAYDAHTHMHSPGPGAAAPTSPPPAPAPLPHSPGPVGSEILKAE